MIKLWNCELVKYALYNRIEMCNMIKYVRYMYIIIPCCSDMMVMSFAIHCSIQILLCQDLALHLLCTLHALTCGVLCQKQVSRAGRSNYIPQYLWNVIICPCPWYLLLAQHSTLHTWFCTMLLGNFTHFLQSSPCILLAWNLPFRRCYSYESQGTN